MLECDSPHCSNIATHYDLMHNLICEDCMTDEIETYGNTPEEYEEV